MKTLKVDNVAQAYLNLLGDRDVDFFLANAGTDFATLVDAFARREAEGTRAPSSRRTSRWPSAWPMAPGSPRPQAVMVHVTVGTANAVCGIITAARSQVPILMSAARTPIIEEGPPGERDLYIHWAQESFDRDAMLREYVTAARGTEVGQRGAGGRRNTCVK